MTWKGAKPVRLYPLVAKRLPKLDTIAIDPAVAFGRPVVLRAGVTTRAIADRLDVGETVAELAKDYGLMWTEIEQALDYEQATRNGSKGA